MEKVKLAKWLHDNYEQVACEKDWKTQERCQVDFDDLPEENKNTMLEVCDRLLKSEELRNHFISESVISGLPKENHYYITLITILNRELADNRIITPSQVKQINNYLVDKMK